MDVSEPRATHINPNTIITHMMKFHSKYHTESPSITVPLLSLSRLLCYGTNLYVLRFVTPMNIETLKSLIAMMVTYTDAIACVWGIVIICVPIIILCTVQPSSFLSTCLFECSDILKWMIWMKWIFVVCG
jgi:hypothetical protein